jgi:hypothetical protein
MKNNKGFILFFAIFVAMIFITGISAAVIVLSFNERRISYGDKKSFQSYYAAEAGIEDILLQLKRNPNLPASNYILNVGDSLSNITLSAVVGGSRTIASVGDSSQRIKKVNVVYSVDADRVSFNYGAQVGAGGLNMGNNSAINGNVFSNGSITGNGDILNSVVVAGNGNKISGIDVGENATTYSCEDSNITGKLTYVAGGTVSSCDSGSLELRTSEITQEALPISLDQINQWKADALAGGVFSGTRTYSGGTNYIGPIQIGTDASPANLIVNGGSTVRLRGIVYVTGSITIGNGAVIELDPSVYGSLSGVLMANGKITANNGSILRGSGQPGSYILALSTSANLTSSNPAIYAGNNSSGAIFYATQGLIYLKNNMAAREITGYKVQLENNAVINYESGLQNANFSSGPGGGWKIVSWDEAQ